MPGHGITGTGPHGHEQRILQVAELLPGLFFDGSDTSLHLALQRRRIGALVLVVVRADVGGDREPGGHRQSDAAHLGEVGALAAEQRLHRAIAVRLLTEPIDVLATLAARLRGAALLLRGTLLRGSLLGHLHCLFLRHSNSLSPVYSTGRLCPVQSARAAIVGADQCH